MRNALIDSGPLIALFAQDDRHHDRFDALVSALSPAGLRLLTTWPCIVQAPYLLATPHRLEMLKWVQLGGVIVYPFEALDLAQMLPWMRRYSERGKREMGLADASLCWLAAETGVTEIMTVDAADFSRYRLPRNNAFILL